MMAYFFKQQGESGRSQNKYPGGHMDHWMKWSTETIESLRSHRQTANKANTNTRGSEERDKNG